MCLKMFNDLFQEKSLSVICSIYACSRGHIYAVALNTTGDISVYSGGVSIPFAHQP